MKEPTSLKQWMLEKEYSNSQLAQTLGASYEIVYKVAEGKRKPTAWFKWKFLERFGCDEAVRVFIGKPS